MPILTHKFAKEDGAAKFFDRLRKAGFSPWITRRTKFVKGLKRYYYEVQYKR